MTAGAIVRGGRQCQITANGNNAREHQQQSAEPLHGPTPLNSAAAHETGVTQFRLLICHFSGCDGLGHAC
jgi:hypothetical protein